MKKYEDMTEEERETARTKYYHDIKNLRRQVYDKLVEGIAAGILTENDTDKLFDHSFIPEKKQ